MAIGEVTNSTSGASALLSSAGSMLQGAQRIVGGTGTSSGTAGILGAGTGTSSNTIISNGNKDNRIFKYGNAGSMPISSATDFDAIVRIETLSGKAIIEESLPVFNVNVGRGMDLSIAKAFSNDIWVADFGETPTTITVSGVSLMAVCDDAKGAYNSPNEVITMLLRNTKNKTPVRICISTGFGTSHTACYNCILVKAQLEADSDTTVKVGKSGKYTLSFIGQKI